MGKVKVRKLSVSFDPELGDAVRGAADRASQTLSGWLAEAAAARLRAEALADFIDSWEAEHGTLTEGELAAAATALRLPLAETGASRPRPVPRGRSGRQRRGQPAGAAGQ